MDGFRALIGEIAAAGEGTACVERVRAAWDRRLAEAAPYFAAGPEAPDALAEIVAAWRRRPGVASTAEWIDLVGRSALEWAARPGEDTP